MIVDVISGFPQSGKTSMLLSLAQDSDALGEVFLLAKDSSLVELNNLDLDSRPGTSIDSAGRPDFGIYEVDFHGQMRAIALVRRPKRLVIEPSPAAAVPAVLEAIRKVSIEGLIKRIRRILVLDGSTFSRYYASSTRFMESQIEISDVVVVNKCDLIDPQQALWILDVAGRVNPEARALLATFGRVDAEQFRSDVCVSQSERGSSEMESFTSVFTGSFDASGLVALFGEFKALAFGNIWRGRGVFRTDNGRVQLDYVNGEVTVRKAADTGISRITLIGSGISRPLLESRLTGCLVADLPTKRSAFKA